VPAIAWTMRLKRLANSYGLLFALHANDLKARRDGDEPGYRAAMVLLATLVGYAELGPALFPYIHQQVSRRAIVTQLVTHWSGGRHRYVRKISITWVGVAGFEPAASSSRTEHTGEQGRCLMTF
jgi:hypothetical protein